MQIQAVKRGKGATWSLGRERVSTDDVQGDSVSSGLIDAFTLHLRLSGKSERTVESYCCHVSLFERSVPASLGQASNNTLRNYIVRLRESGTYSHNTINLKIRSLKRFYGYLKTVGRILDDPSCDIKESKAPGRLPRSILSASDMETVRRSITGTSVLDSRNRALVEVLYSTGLRLSEIAGLDVCDIDFQAGVLKIRKGKGSNDRMAVLSTPALQALSNYMKARRGSRIAALWVSHFGRSLRRECLGCVLKNLAMKAGVTRPAHPHAWRHGIATELLRRGASIREVQVFLGHASPRTTQVYTHVAAQDLKEIHQKTHPRERDTDPVRLLKDFSFNCFPQKCRLMCYVCGHSRRRA